MKVFVPLSVGVLALSLTPELTTAIAVLVGAVFLGLVNLYSARTQRLVALKQIADAIAPITKKVDDLGPVVAKIEGHVNSEKTKAEGEIANQRMQIELQRTMIDEMKRAAALLAQAQASANTADAVSRAAVAGATVPGMPARQVRASDSVVLEKIETNTDETAKNTAKTDAAVQTLKEKE